MRDLQLKSVSDLSRADIIVMASEVFETEVYWQRFEYLSAQSEDWLNDKAGGCFFVDRLETAMKSLRDQTELMAGDGGVESASDVMAAMYKAVVEEAEKKKDAHKTANFGKRMKGQAYRDRYNGDPAKKKANLTTEEVEKWEASEEESSVGSRGVISTNR